MTASEMAAIPTERDSLLSEVTERLDSKAEVGLVSAVRSKSLVGPASAPLITMDGPMVSEDAPIEVEIGTADSPAVGDSWAGAFSLTDPAPTSEDAYGPQTVEKLRTLDRLFAAVLSSIKSRKVDETPSPFGNTPDLRGTAFSKTITPYAEPP